MKNELILDYIRATTNLYGVVSINKVVEIYNTQNDDKINEEDMNLLLNNDINPTTKNYLAEGFVEIHGNYFVSESILENDEFEEQLKQREGKPFYIPEKEELLKYKDETYYEVTKEYKALLSYVTKNFPDVNAEILCEDIQGICQFAFSTELIFDSINNMGVNFKDEKQVNEMMQLIMDLANHTRIRENNGHTPNEIFELMKKPNLMGILREQMRVIKKVGRNDPCPCGSGKNIRSVVWVRMI